MPVVTVSQAPFHLDYRPAAIHYGRGSVDDLGTILDDEGCQRAMIFCGKNTGASTSLMDPIREALGDRLVDIYTGSTPAKHIDAVYEAAERIAAQSIDILIPVGGGATLDMARGIRVLAAHEASLATLRNRINRGESIELPNELLPIVGIPTTLAGSGLSIVGGARQAAEYQGTPDPDAASSLAGYTVIDPRLMPTALVYDPALFETTPTNVLAASAMNGFDKAIEILYTRNATPITDGTGIQALRHFHAGLPALHPDKTGIDDAVLGLILGQYGMAQEHAYRAAIIHAFGHGFSLYYDIAQGDIHAIVAPRVLEYVFSQVDGRRRLIAEGLGIETADRSDDGIADDIVAIVRDIRDALDRPTRLRTIPELDRNDLTLIAEKIEGDLFMENNPPGLDPATNDIEAILEDLW